LDLLRELLSMLEESHILLQDVDLLSLALDNIADRTERLVLRGPPTSR